jgi:hypothetical protein
MVFDIGVGWIGPTYITPTRACFNELLPFYKNKTLDVKTDNSESAAKLCLAAPSRLFFQCIIGINLSRPNFSPAPAKTMRGERVAIAMRNTLLLYVAARTDPLQSFFPRRRQY